MRWCYVMVLVLTACSSKPPDTSEAVLSLIERGDLQEAAAQSKRLITARPADPALRLLLGRVYLAQKDGAAAYDAFNHARELGASEESTRGGLVESLVMQREYEQVFSVLPTSIERSEIPVPLIRLRLDALLRSPLARPRDVFLDSRQLLSGGADGAASLEVAVRGEGVFEANADHVRRAIAYWSCQQVHDEQDEPAPAAPAWAVRDTASRRTLRVGPGLELKTPSAAARIARDGDNVEIQAGLYAGDVATWRANDLWIHAVGGKAVLEARGASAENVGTWVIRGNNVSIAGMKFSGARSPDQNGSGIRALGDNLWVSESEFYDNEDGILTAERPRSEVIIERSVFVGNGAGDGYSHNVYVGTVRRLVFRFNYSAATKIGHELKSRALENYILYNRLANEEGDGSYVIDLPDGGVALILGNEIQKGPNSTNPHAVSLGEERPAGREHRFVFAFNTFYNNLYPATLIRDATRAGVTLIDNVMTGAPAGIDARTPESTALKFVSPENLVDGRGGDYRLKPTATVIDSGEATASEVNGLSIVPEFEYRHPAGARRRHDVWRRDPGAHEFCGWPDYRE